MDGEGPQSTNFARQGFFGGNSQWSRDGGFGVIIIEIETPEPVDKDIFIGPESDHWECLSVADSLTHSCLVNLIDVTLACEDGNSKLVEVVTVVDVDDEKRCDYSFMQIWKLKFGHKSKFWSDFENKVWSRV